MSSYIKDLYDYDLVKRCSKCNLICLISNFYKNSSTKDSLHSQKKICVIQRQSEYDSKKRLKKRDYYLRIIIIMIKLKNIKMIKGKKRTTEKKRKRFNFYINCYYEE